MKKISVEKHEQIYKLLMAFVFSMVCSVLVYTGVDLSTNINVDAPKDIGFSGSYTIDNSQPVKYSKNKQITTEKDKTVVFEGHFTKNIKKGECVNLFIDGFDVSVAVNGETVFDSANESNHDLMVNEGDVWKSFKTNGISTDDNVTISILIKNDIRFESGVNKLLNNIVVGQQSALIHRMMVQNWFEFFISIFIISIGIAFFFMSSILSVGKDNNYKNGRLFALMIISSGIAVLSVNNDMYICLLTKNPVFDNVLQEMSLFAVPIFLTSYIVGFIKGKAQQILIALTYILISILFIIIIFECYSIIAPMEATNFGICVIFFTILILSAFVFYEAIKNKSILMKIMAVSFVPLIFVGAMSMLYLFAKLDTQYCLVTIGLLVFTVVHVFGVGLLILNGSKKEMENVRLDKELQDSNIAITLSQIQPHFLYNSLNTIQFLCEENSKQAVDAIGHFSKYLRENMDSLKFNGLISFADEMAHIDNYLYLEKLRFGERIRFEYDLKVKDFYLPTMTIQPIVENAVKHGIGKRVDGGKIRVSTKKTDFFIEIMVMDDGVGFDVNTKMDDGKTHIGIENVRKRLNLQCSGDLSISSTVGEGTVVKITIPIEQAKLK